MKYKGFHPFFSKTLFISRASAGPVKEKGIPFSGWVLNKESMGSTVENLATWAGHRKQAAFEVEHPAGRFRGRAAGQGHLSGSGDAHDITGCIQCQNVDGLMPCLSNVMVT
jgi:hypothetical protein